jgi:hypothetical protein
MSFYRKSIIKKPRKKYICEICKKEIIGEHVYVANNYYDSSTISSYRAHLECEKEMKDNCVKCGGWGCRFDPIECLRESKQGKKFYLQHKGYCGNCLLWWKHNNCGYTCNIKEAKVFSEEEADAKCRQSDLLKKWDKEYIDAHAELHANIDTLNERDGAS